MYSAVIGLSIALGLIVLGVSGITSAEKKEGVVLGLLGFLSLVFGICFGLYSLIAPSREVIAQETVTRHTIVAVNGKYIDAQGNIITEDDMRVKITSPIVLYAADCPRAPVLLVHDITYVKDFSHYGGKDKTFTVETH